MHLGSDGPLFRVTVVEEVAKRRVFLQMILVAASQARVFGACCRRYTTQLPGLFRPQHILELTKLATGDDQDLRRSKFTTGTLSEYGDIIVSERYSESQKAERPDCQ